MSYVDRTESGSGPASCGPRRRRDPIELGAGWLAAATFAALFGVALVGYLEFRSFSEALRRVDLSHALRSSIIETIQSVTDAETGQRGYLLTADPSYLDPYRSGVAAAARSIAAAAASAGDDPEQRSGVAEMRRWSATRLAELAETLAIYDSHGHAAAMQLMQSDAGKHAMDEMRRIGDAVARRESALLDERTRQLHGATSRIEATVAAAFVLLLAALPIGFLALRRELRSRAQAQARADAAAAENLAANEQLARAKADLQGILDNAPGLISYWNRDGTNRYANRAYAEWHGMSEEYLRGRHMREVLGEELFAKCDWFIEAALAGDRQSFEQTERRRDREMRHNQIDYVPHLRDGEVVGLFVFVSDISRRIVAEQALATSALRYQRSYEATPAMLHSIDTHGVLVAVSDTWLEKLGYKRDEVLGRRSVEFLTPVSREYATQVVMPEFFRTGHVRDVSYQMVRKDGSIIDVLMSAIAEYDVDERFSHSLAAIEDVTARKRAEEELRASESRMRLVVDNLPARIAYWGQNARCVFGNKVYADHYGLQPEQLPGLTPTELLGESGYADAKVQFEAALQGRRGYAERWLRSRRGEVPLIQISYIPDVVDGEQRGFFTFGIDVTELNRQVQERTRELLVAKDAAERASRVKDEIIANVSHEMRTPLHSIQSFARLGLTRIAPDTVDKCRTYFERIYGSGTRLSRFVEQILDLARLSSGEMTVQREEANLVDLVRKVVGDLAPLFDEKNLDIKVCVETTQSDAEVDPPMVERVLVNLLSNATKFSPDGGTVVVALSDARLSKPADAARAACRITVADEGPGIPEAELDAIFDPFVQSTRTDKKIGGSGLGLAIVRKIVALHDGEVLAANRPAGGAALEVLLPRRGQPTRTVVPTAYEERAGSPEAT